MKKLFLFSSFIIIVLVVLTIVFVAGSDRVPDYPVKISGLENFLADISQIIKFGPAKRVEVSITDQKIKMFEGEKLVDELPVSTGLPDTPTPVGTFKIYNKNFCS